MKPETERLAWIDLLRVAACFMVVFSHCCDPFVAQFDADRASFLTGTFLGSLVRPCVPLFVMMTGVLLLPTGMSAGEFYRRRIGRIAIPLVFWSVALPLMFFLYFGVLHPYTANPAVDVANHTWAATFPKLWTFIFNFTFDTTPLWYLYMLVGLYLIMPVLSSWLEHAEKRDIRTFLIVWGISLFLPYVQLLAPSAGYAGNYGNMGIYGVCDWNVYGMFYYVSGFVGYVVLAYYMKKYPSGRSRLRTFATAVPVFAAGYLITAFGYVFLQSLFPGNYAYLEIIWYFTGINVFMMTVPLFAIAVKSKIRPRAWLKKLADASFGIYLCHFIFVEIAYDVFDIAALPYAVRIACMAVTAFAVSFLLVRILSSAKITRRLVA